jgi:Protein of Unknown function (DUF2784)
MVNAFLADAVLVLHGLFIVFVLLGGLTVLWRGVMAWVHLPAVAWGVWVSWSGSYCPLTPLEQSLRRAAGQAGYEGGFIEHYLTAAIYPEGLTPELQIVFGAIVVAINLLVYGFVLARAARQRRMA